DGLADPLLSQLRQPAGHDVSTIDPVPQELLAAVRTAGSRRERAVRPAAEKGCRLGKFELLEELGVGSFGQVFRARDKEVDRPVPIKTLRAAGSARPEDMDRFLREARSAAQLKHPGIVSLYETGQTAEGTCYLVEEFVPGATLASRLTVGRFTFRQ